ncbi:MAG: SAM-dependent methyltransferase [Ferrovibrio sp.]|uniref:class I SAM-dependent methyltransferase n=1 Tax=Ferrovibrio sp. TaxID=1917215 RepID=UPI002630D506|nr:SAM-dependent methyltransferase [Ferrovibrio sp.]MCW0236637.1 SAM-dependent methyltransferase [Ferrovibrio sp.]
MVAAATGGVKAAPLLDILRRRIAAEGPITVTAYMADCLLHPEHGYYRSQEAIGLHGDFITAPEISQMFGELLGLWAADYWQRMGAPAQCYLVELGPGRGTLMRDALRAARALPAFRAALTPVLVEASARLRGLQAAALEGEGAIWHEQIAAIPKDAPLLLLANEFLDALPVRQFQRGDDGAWHERCVGLDEATNGLRFLLDPRALPFDDLLPPVLRDSPPGSIVESSPPVRAVAVEVAARLKHQGGAALFIDYGYASAGVGETLQAVYRHTYADPLENPGLADLTAHVDFGSFALAAKRAGVTISGPVGQGAFLNALGIKARAAKLQQGNGAQAGDVDQALRRLTAPEAMGTLFKVLALTPPESPQPAGFA